LEPTNDLHDAGTAGRPTGCGDADADAQVAAYLADIAAHVGDPQSGEELRVFLNDGSEFQRAMFDFVEALTAPLLPPSRRTLAWPAVAALILAAAYVALVIRFIS
jgi:hypothetical protein